MEINENDIKSFAKVLVTLGELLREKPELLSQLLESCDNSGIIKELPEELKEMESLQIYEIAKEKKQEDFIEYLKKYNSEQLRYLIKISGFGSISSKSKEKLASHIADAISKRSADVFRNYE